MDNLNQVNTTVQQMKEPNEKNKPLEDDNTTRLTCWLKKGAATVEWMADEFKMKNQGKSSRVSMWPVGIAPTKPTVVCVSCTSPASTKDARAKIEDLIIRSDGSFEMPDTYTRVLKNIVSIRKEAMATVIATRISRVSSPIDTLPAVLKIKPDVCHTILQTLHDLGDVLWYEDLGVALFGNTGILEPLLLIDFIRQVFDHRHTDQILPHAVLKGKPFWVALDSSNFSSERKQMEAMKRCRLSTWSIQLTSIAS